MLTNWLANQVTNSLTDVAAIVNSENRSDRVTHGGCNWWSCGWLAGYLRMTGYSVDQPVGQSVGQSARPQVQDPWNVFSICRNASGMWTHSFQMLQIFVIMEENPLKFHFAYFCMWAMSMFRIPKNAKHMHTEYSDVCILLHLPIFRYSPDIPVSIFCWILRIS